LYGFSGLSFRILPVYPVFANSYSAPTTDKGVKEMTKLAIVANIHANPDRIDLVKAELEKLLPITRAEQGCLQYDLHRDNDHPAHFMVFENWESRELWQRHMNAPHLAAYLQATDGAVAQFTLNEMTHIG
jgi:quinol monooxygenase YgiN